MIGAMGMLRAIELGVLPSVTRDPPGPFDVGWPETASLRPPEVDIGNIDAGEEPLILLFAQGACAEHVGTVCLPWDDEMARPGREGALCRQIGEVWNKLPKDWRFACAVSGSNGRILATPALMGQIGALGGMERNTAEKAAAR